MRPRCKFGGDIYTSIARNSKADFGYRLMNIRKWRRTVDYTELSVHLFTEQTRSDCHKRIWKWSTDALVLQQYKGQGKRIFLHTFPHGDKKRLDLWNKFVKLKRKDWLKASPTSVLCSSHFRQDDFCNFVEFKVGYVGQLYLKNTAVPTIHREMSPKPSKSQQDLPGVGDTRRSLGDFVVTQGTWLSVTVTSWCYSFNETLKLSFSQFCKALLPWRTGHLK